MFLCAQASAIHGGFSVIGAGSSLAEGGEEVALVKLHEHKIRQRREGHLGTGATDTTR
eukprot:COSAG05_NODE_2929_length_2495_cov_1.626461_3_plen_58_part_00